MAYLFLFSLDTLIDVPLLYTNAIERIFEKRIAREHILSLIGTTKLNAKNVIHILCEEDPQSKTVDEMYTQFKEKVYEGAHHHTPNGSFKVVRGLKEQGKSVGIFYSIDEAVLKKIVKSSKLPVDIIAGEDCASDLTTCAERAYRSSHAKKLKLVLGSTVNVATDLEERLNADVSYYRTSQHSMLAFNDLE